MRCNKIKTPISIPIEHIDQGVISYLYFSNILNLIAKLLHERNP